MEDIMVFSQLCLIVFTVRGIELFIQYLYHYIKNICTSKITKEKKEQSYKRLSADVSHEFHQEVSEMATKRNVTLKEYILGAIMMRLKLDKAE